MASFLGCVDVLGRARAGFSTRGRELEDRFMWDGMYFFVFVLCGASIQQRKETSRACPSKDLVSLFLCLGCDRVGKDVEGCGGMRKCKLAHGIGYYDREPLRRPAPHAD